VIAVSSASLAPASEAVKSEIPATPAKRSVFMVYSLAVSQRRQEYQRKRAVQEKIASPPLFSGFVRGITQGIAGLLRHRPLGCSRQKCASAEPNSFDLQFFSGILSPLKSQIPVYDFMPIEFVLREMTLFADFIERKIPGPVARERIRSLKCLSKAIAGRER
jgi:hypothetical protein